MSYAIQILSFIDKDDRTLLITKLLLTLKDFDSLTPLTTSTAGNCTLLGTNFSRLNQWFLLHIAVRSRGKLQSASTHDGHGFQQLK